MFNERLGLDNIQTERAYRVRNKRSKDKKTKPRAILSYKRKKEVLITANKLKGTDIFINEIFCPEIMEHRKELWEHVKRLRSEGQITYLNYRSIAVRGRDQGE